MKVRITERPVGYISLAGQPLTAWPPAGSVVDLPEGVARDLIAAGRAEKVPGWSGREWLWPWNRSRAKPSGPTQMTVRITVRPTGCVSIDGGPLSAWPRVGSVVDLPYAVAEGLIAGGFAETVTPEAGEPKTVRLKVKRAWPKVGAEIDLPEDIAGALVAGGMADEVTQSCP